jgi:hypothetical protein
MIVEERIYTLQPGKVPEMVRLYGEEGLPLQQKYLGRFIGYFTVEAGGNVNQVVFLWGYDSADDRETRRAALAKDPEWQAYLKKVMQILVKQENRLLKPTAFSPIR